MTDLRIESFTLLARKPRASTVGMQRLPRLKLTTNFGLMLALSHCERYPRMLDMLSPCCGESLKAQEEGLGTYEDPSSWSCRKCGTRAELSQADQRQPSVLLETALEDLLPPLQAAIVLGPLQLVLAAGWEALEADSYLQIASYPGWRSRLALRIRLGGYQRKRLL